MQMVTTRAPGAGGRRVLLVNGSERIRRRIRNGLSLIDCRLREEHCGVQALSQLRNQDYSLLITGLLLPGSICGLDLALEAVRLQPELKVLVVGHCGVADPRVHQLLFCCGDLIGREFSGQEFASKVSGLLQAGRPRLIEVLSFPNRPRDSR